MFEIEPANAVAYLQSKGWLDRRTPAHVESLAWGVSNAVLRVTPSVGKPFVLKQSRLQLRTQAAWFSRLERVWREIDVMRLLEPLLPAGIVPRVLFEDRENYLFAMEAAPAHHQVWKQMLLAGNTDRKVAGRLGSFLATIHCRTAQRTDLAEVFDDRQVFVELRVDPFYRRIAEVWPELAAPVGSLIDEMFATRVCLVHADFSPKNVLIAGGQIVLVDFETGHYGDPAFDLGFFLSHLLLKTVLHAERFTKSAALTTEFWRSYLAAVSGLVGCTPFVPNELLRRTTAHLAACMLARIDGTSQIDYLNERQHAVVREFCRGIFADPPVDWTGILDRLAKTLETLDLHVN